MRGTTENRKILSTMRTQEYERNQRGLEYTAATATTACGDATNDETASVAATLDDGSTTVMQESIAESSVSLVLPVLGKKVAAVGSSYREALCAKCVSECVEYMSDPCRCFRVCRSCAMKMATGGKCKFCKEYFTGFKGIIPAASAQKDTGDD
jgi:hypothetical protein